MASNLLDNRRKKVIVEKLNELIQYARDNSDFYKEKYRDFLPISNFEDIKKIECTNRDELQAYYPCKHLCKKLNEIDAYFETSGSTGNPLSVIPDMSYTKASNFGEYLNFWMKLKNDRIQMAIVALPYEMNPMGLKYHMALMSQNVTVIPTSVRSTLCSPRKIIRLIQDLKPQLIVGRPLEIMRYAEGMKYLRINPEKCSIRKIFLTGETMSDAKWKKINDLYGGVDIYSTYGLTELDTGLVSCEDYRYHLPNSTNILVEVVDDDGKQVKEGEVGNIVITNLEKNYSPLIRYNTGDVGYFSSMCKCGSDMPCLEILGRKVDARIIDGRKIFPVDVENVLYQIDGLGCEYQLVINNNKLTIHAEQMFDYKDEKAILEKEVKKQLKMKLNLEADVIIYSFNDLSDKFGIAKAKGCRFIDITDLDAIQIEKVLKINICDGIDLD